MKGGWLSKSKGGLNKSKGGLNKSKGGAKGGVIWL